MTDKTLTIEDNIDTPPKPNVDDAPEDQDGSKPVDGENADDEPGIDPDDTDAIELREAEAALEAEGKEGTDDSGKPAGEEAKPEAADAKSGDKPEDAKSETEKPEAATQETADGTDKAGEKKPEGDQAETKGVMIPKGRLDEISRAKRQSDLTAAYWRGVAEARGVQLGQGTAGQGQQEGQEGTAQQETPETRIAAVREQKRGVAKQFEEGELTAVQWEEKRQELDDQEFAIRQEAAPAQTVQSQAQGQQQPQPQAQDLYLDSLMDGLEAKHPFATQITDDVQWAYLEAEAKRALLDEGVELRSDAPSTLALRTRMAELTDIYGPVMTGKTLDEVKAAQSSKSNQGQDGQPAPADDKGKPGELSEKAQQRKEKLDLSKGLPPDISNLGSAGSGTEIPSEERIASMTDEEITALPKPVLDKILPE